jgi:hypothetical protein
VTEARKLVAHSLITNEPILGRRSPLADVNRRQWIAVTTPTCPPSGQRCIGFPHKKDGNGDGVAIVDIGSFER